MKTKNYIILLLLVIGLGKSLLAQDSCIVLDGVNDYVQIPPIDLTDSAEITLEAWIKPDRLTHHTYTEIFRQNGRGIPAAWLLSFQNRGKLLSFGIRTKSGYKELDIAVTPADYVGKWTHIAATYDGDQMITYVNGIPLDSQTYKGGLIDVYTVANIHRVGVSVRSEWFDGKIDEVRIWHVARTRGQIKKDKDCAITSPRKGLISVYNFSEGTGTVTKDASGNANHGILRNGTKWDTSSVATDCYCRTPDSSLSLFACDTLLSPSGKYLWTSTGKYTDTLKNSRGCDSVLKINLKIGETLSTLDTVVCESFKSPSGKYTWILSGTYADTLKGSNSCDSIIRIRLTVHKNSRDTLQVTTCTSYTSPSGLFKWSKSGVYRDTTFSSSGCYRLYLIYLSIGTLTVDTIYRTECDSFISPSGKHVWTSSGTYVDTVKGPSGCDSILFVDLKILKVTYLNRNRRACSSYVSPSGKYTWTQSGIYRDTVSTLGCDSIYRIRLTIDSATFSTVTYKGCDSLISPSGTYVWKTSGTYTDTVPNSSGCDSIITAKVLIGKKETYSTLSTKACLYYVSPDGNKVWTSSGTYKDTIPNTTGCDSIITVILTINRPTHDTIYRYSCDSLRSPSGLYLWTVSGTYKDTLTASTGCDSIFTVLLTIDSGTLNSIKVRACKRYTSPSSKYVWTQSGTYRDTLKSIKGCDSILIIRLRIDSNTYSTLQLKGCKSLLSPSGKYLWTTSGQYSDTIKNSGGCDSILTVQLLIGQTPSYSTVNLSLCEPYTSPSGKHVWTTSGSYQDTVTNHLGCDSIISINLTIHLPTYSSLNASACDSYLSPSGKTWTASGSYSDTVLNTNGCDSIISILLTVLQSSANTLTIRQCGVYTSPSGKYQWTTSGTYTDTLKNAQGCDSVITIQLTVGQKEKVLIRRTACEQYTSPSGSRVWTQSGVYNEVLTSSLGCDSTVTVYLTIVTADSIEIDYTGCGTFLSPSGRYEWTKTGRYRDTLPGYFGCDSIVIFNLTIPNTAAQVFDTVCSQYTSPTGKLWTKTGTYKDVIPNAVGCDSVITFYLVVTEGVKSNIEVKSCRPILSPSGRYTWSATGLYIDTITAVSGCDSIIFMDLSILPPLRTNQQISSCSPVRSPSGKYLWTLTGTYTDTLLSVQGCDSILTVDLTRLTRSRAVQNMNACGPVQSPSGRYSWDSSGIYFDTLVNSVGCDSIITTRLNIDYLSVNLGNDRRLCGDDIARLEVTKKPGERFLWSDGSTGKSILVEKSGRYWLEVKKGDCTASDSVNIVIDYEDTCGCQFFVPNSFTPDNTDGLNDFFKVTTTCQTTFYTLKVFDRWGAMVFYSDDPQQGWDGLKNDNQVVLGRYFYMLEAETTDGSIHQMHGGLNVVR